jgi:hypothetical protein
MKNLLALLCILNALAAFAQIPISNSSLHYLQNFDSLDSAGTSLSRMPAGWSFFEWGGSSCNATYRASTGTGTSGDTYSYGLSNSSERALGSLCSSGMPNVCYGLRFVNLTGSYLNAVDITFKAEQWRRNGSGKSDSMLFYYSTNSNSVVNDSSFINWTQVPELLVTSVTKSLPAAALNGNDTSKRIAFSLPLALAPGDTICFRWYDYNAIASDDGLAIDSLDMLFHSGIPPGLFRPHVVRLYPEPGAQDVAANATPTIEFDRVIVKGSTGAVYIKDRNTQLVQSLTFGSSKLKTNGHIASMYLLNLQAGHTYQITFDSTVFDTAGFHCVGLYDTTAWTFTVEAPTQVLSISENEEFVVVNPVKNGMLRILQGSPVGERWDLVISDLRGRRVFYRKINAMPKNGIFEVELEIPRGFYVLNLISGGVILRKEIVVE